jgi:hypothetical protein
MSAGERGADPLPSSHEATTAAGIDSSPTPAQASGQRDLLQRPLGPLVAEDPDRRRGHRPHPDDGSIDS